MLAEDIYAIMLFSSLILVVPGPSNTLLLSAGFHFGSLRAAPFILLEALGYSLSISAFLVVLAPIGMLWVGLGAGIRKGYLGSISGPLFSKVTSVILALFSASLTYTMVRAA
ncbi:hypothetical protein [Pseudomonas aeruginosa]|uniref:hypothetical protein n=1 Tax=Pseudomonas aeruginosa TaxID=287 RepID=UPI000FF4C237|nr:hypothetical protein [Pseudomonas aeruginosa]RPO53200.1 hypothetical protein IPC1225_14945 [Pseudomonas aeruginosa]